MRFLEAFRAQRLGSLVLGTAQLGMSYGVANKTGKPDPERAASLLTAAWNAGIRVVDTAQSYGDSERLIGNWLAAHPGRPLHVVTKLASSVEPNRTAIVRAARQSCEVLGQPVAALLAHDATVVETWNAELQAALDQCLELGLAESVGVSIYTPAQFRAALKIPAIQTIQAPFNALDRRLLQTGLLDRALAGGRAILLRSVFLQGLMVLDAGEVPARLEYAERDLARWRQLCARRGESLASAAVGYVRRAAPRALIAIGCETVEQISTNARLAAAHKLPDALVEDIERLPQPDERVINPSLWPRE
jgi:aryl-alcohol dehydrogenase-like predicted oxidoreductase